MVTSKLKVFSTEGAGKPSLNRAKMEYYTIDPKPSDLSMNRLKPE